MPLSKAMASGFAVDLLAPTLFATTQGDVPIFGKRQLCEILMSTIKSAAICSSASRS